MDAILYWIGFTLVKGIGAVRFKGLIDYFGSLEVAWQAPVDALRAAGLSQKIIENLAQVRAQVDLEQVMARMEKLDIHALTWNDARYPERLKQIDQPPPVLYVRGELAEADSLAVAVVGTRRSTAYGRQVAEELGAFLARSGITVVSGLARGVDTHAHRSALEAGGRNLAVLGCGVDQIYPPENRKLGEQIAASGAILSDYAPGTPPDAQNFPPRNRIISGISMATVVVEAGQTSGALITATFAAEQGREVFAVPGYIHAPQSAGTNRLIQEGAHPLLKMEDVLEVLQLEHAKEYRQARLLLPADDTEARLLGVLKTEPLHVDDIRALADLPIEQVSATLAIMELKGMIRQVGGMSYVAVREEQGGYSTGGRSI